MKPVLYSLLSNHHTTGTFFVFIALYATGDNEKNVSRMIIVKMPEKTPIATYLVNSSETGSSLPEVCQKDYLNISKTSF